MKKYGKFKLDEYTKQMANWVIYQLNYEFIVSHGLSVAQWLEHPSGAWKVMGSIGVGYSHFFCRTFVSYERYWLVYATWNIRTLL